MENYFRPVCETCPNLWKKYSKPENLTQIPDFTHGKPEVPVVYYQPNDQSKEKPGPYLKEYREALPPFNLPFDLVDDLVKVSLQLVIAKCFVSAFRRKKNFQNPSTNMKVRTL